MIKIGGALMRKVLACAAIFIAGIACGLILAYGPGHAQESVNEGDIMAKLNEISKSQEGLATAINSIKEDLQIIKIRVTQSQ